MRALQTFAQALGRVTDDKKPYILLGNGFSRAWRDDIFSYEALLNEANFDGLSKHARKAFAALGTTDFEVVMRALQQAAELVKLYKRKDPGLAEQLWQDAHGLREVLVRTIADNHPSLPSAVTEKEYRSCRAFLSNFDWIYTLNYDLLLYRTIMQQDLEPSLEFDDGFRTPEEGREPYVTWEVENTNRQSLHYLHGALHVFDAGTEIQKYTWVNTGIRLMDQIREALESNLYPLFVAEGESDQKLRRIKHSDFLSRAYRSFAKIRRPLFIYGHALAANDLHVLRLIARGMMSQVFVGIYGDPGSPSNRQILRIARSLPRNRRDRYPLVVEFYDAASAHVWR